MIFKVAKSLAIIIILVSLAVPLIAQQRSGDTDMALGIPQPMRVNEVDLASRTVVLDGQTYRVATAEQIRANAGDARDLLTLRDLRAGMDILVSTDGSVAQQGHQPMIRAMWRTRE